MPRITGNLVNAYFVCRRKLWLYAHEVNPFADHDLLETGRIYDQFTYKREKDGITMDGMKIDLLRRGEGQTVVGEVKKSSAFLNAARMQLAYYLYRLRKEGIEAEGELLIPKEKKREKVRLDEALTRELEQAISEIQRIIDQERAPEAKKTRFCAKCAYAEFCWS
jgi:CRISPR-associated exonuclease Cas4